jgi:hypothetical protein
LTAPCCSTTIPTAIFFFISTISLFSSTFLCSTPSLHYLTTSFWYRARQANYHCSLWNTHFCPCTFSSKAWVGPRPPSCEFESGSACFGMESTLLSIHFSSFVLSTAYIHYYTILHSFVPFLFDYSPVATRALPLWRGVHVAVWHATTVAGFGRFRSGHVTLGRHPCRVDTFLRAFPVRVVRLDVSTGFIGTGSV